MIYILCPKPETPSGGVWFLHRLTELLNDNGREARLVMPDPFLIWWDSPIDPSYILPLFDARACDLLIVPECLATTNYGITAQRTVVFVQNHIWLSREAYVPEVWAVSRYIANWIKRTLKMPSHIVRPWLDGDIWHPTPKQANKTLILSRRTEIADEVVARLLAEDFPVMYLQQAVTRDELAFRLHECEFYVHLPYPEGFPFACLEAMRCGTIVVGTTGGGGNEFMHHRETAMVAAGQEVGDKEMFVNEIVANMKTLREDATMRSRIWTQAHEWSLRYTKEATLKELLEAIG